MSEKEYERDIAINHCSKFILEFWANIARYKVARLLIDEFRGECE